MIEELFSRPQYSIPQDQKEKILADGLVALTEHHRSRCSEYATILDRLGYPKGKVPSDLSRLPYLPVSLFKSHFLRSIPDDEITTEMTSSGTSGQAVSRIAIDAETAALQVRALASVITHIVGSKRLPMLIFDANKTIRDPRLLSARGAGILGLMRFGRDHTFVLDDEMNLDIEALTEFLARHGDETFLVFGFTFMVWKYLYEGTRQFPPNLSNGILIHGGGWKKLSESAVDNDEFKTRLKDSCRLDRVYNFYGMVEQIGTVFMEGEDRYLYAPNFADVIIRDPVSWEPSLIGQPGVIEVLSLVPRSYPGHILLTEDLGVLHSVDSGVGGRIGKAFSVIGRAPRAELRGCSDTHAYKGRSAA